MFLGWKFPVGLEIVERQGGAGKRGTLSGRRCSDSVGSVLELDAEFCKFVLVVCAKGLREAVFDKSGT